MPDAATRLPSSGPGTRREEVLTAYRRHVNVGQARLAQLLGLPVERSAQGVHVTGDDGRRYLDCGGYSVFLLGHRHPAVVAAVRAQLDRQPLATRLFLNERMAQAAQMLADVSPTGLERVTFTTSGAEAVELALKLGRASGRRRIVAAENGFHGKTLGALSATGRSRYRDPFLPLLADVEHVKFGDIDDLDRALRSGPPATVVLEPIQAEAGALIPPAGYLSAVRALTRAHGALLVADEVQTGLGRLGSWWGVVPEGVVPDVLLAGKALGGGVMPVAAVISSCEAYAPLDVEPLLHSSTFAGNPLAAAAAVATLQVLAGDGLVERAMEVGSRLRAAVEAAVRTAGRGLVRDVRGRGLLVGVELVEPHHAALLLGELLTDGVIVSYSLNADAVVRLTPPAILDDVHIDRIHEAFEASLGRLR
jgi:putrescine aminotransferase